MEGQGREGGEISPHSDFKKAAPVVLTGSVSHRCTKHNIQLIKGQCTKLLIVISPSLAAVICVACSKGLRYRCRKRQQSDERLSLITLTRNGRLALNYTATAGCIDKS